jgi:hypothetical protein
VDALGSLAVNFQSVAIMSLSILMQSRALSCLNFRELIPELLIPELTLTKNPCPSCASRDDRQGFLVRRFL